MTVAGENLFQQLDYLYMPSRDVAADLRFFVEVLGAQPVFAIDGMGARVAMVELGESPPHVLLADHLEGDAPVLVYRVADLEAGMAALKARGWQGGARLEIPQGPICSFVAPGGHRLAIYQRTRPGVIESFAGRRDF
jgi:catechol 2,3-dioxygenase-like lactoylglutathione lyase family enzyme